VSHQFNTINAVGFLFGVKKMSRIIVFKENWEKGQGFSFGFDSFTNQLISCIFYTLWALIRCLVPSLSLSFSFLEITSDEILEPSASNGVVNNTEEKPPRPPVPIRVSSREKSVMPTGEVTSMEQLQNEYADIAKYKIFQLAGESLLVYHYRLLYVDKVWLWPK